MTKYFTLFLTLLFAIPLSASDQLLKPLEVLQVSKDSELSSPILLADKMARKLYFFSSPDQLNTNESFEIDIGKSDGNKTKRDDHKTPEGIYLLQEKMTQPQIPFDLYGSLAFTTNYPNVFDKYDNKTGSGIWLHSVPDNVPLNRGSRGCVVVRNDIIKSLSDKISLNKSYLIINDKTNWVDFKTHSDRRLKITNWVQNWKSVWEAQNLENYIQLYSDRFSAPGFNKNSWLKHKEKLKKMYSKTSVGMGEPHIFHQKNQYLVKFVQNYSSDKHQDKGIKTLYLIEENNSLKILREEWSAL